MQAIVLPRLADLPGDELTARLYDLRRRERHLQVEFLAYLGELERRELHLALGFSSLFAFCVDHLGLSRSAAFRRITAARLLGKFPAVGAYLADGRLSLTTLVELREVLEEARLDEILARAAGKNEEDVKLLVAALRPKPAPPELLRRLPAPAPAAAAVTPPTATPPPLPRLVPVAPQQHVLRLTVDDAFVADLQAVRAALSHQLPAATLDQVIHHCLKAALEQCQRRQRGAGKAVDTRPSRPGSRYVPAAVRDLVWRRDEGRCAFVGTAGHRCDSTYQLQVHHVTPFARGGEATIENLFLLCASHNGYQARQDFGAQAALF